MVPLQGNDLLIERFLSPELLLLIYKQMLSMKVGVRDEQGPDRLSRPWNWEKPDCWFEA